jgi:hypothetical protein
VAVHQLTVAHPQLIVYYPDINLENFVYNERERRVKIVDLENMIIVGRQSTAVQRAAHRSHFDPGVMPSTGEFCTSEMPDFNIKQSDEPMRRVARVMCHVSCVVCSLSVHLVADVDVDRRREDGQS